MDLIGLEVRRRQQETLFTVLHRPGNSTWTKAEVNQLTSIGCGTEVYGHPQHPQDLILYGTFERAAIITRLGHDDFSSVEVQGVTHPDLPFTPPV